jgi:hypothetical protein
MSSRNIIQARCSLCGQGLEVQAPPGITAACLFAICPDCGDAEHLQEGGAILQLRSEPEGSLFPLGRVRITEGAISALERAGLRAPELLARHARGDWGKAGHYAEITVTDREMRDGCFATSIEGKLNKISVTKKQGRVLSIYPKVGGENVWVLTDLDGGQAETTVLLGNEY